MSTTGLLAVFESAADLERATRELAALGLRAYDPLSPFPLEKIFPFTPHERKHSPVGLLFPRLNLLGAIALAAALGGGLFGFALQWVANSWAYPLDVGGRPNFSWPAYLPVTFELAVLSGALAIFLGLLLTLRLPEPWHPYFSSPRFDLSADRFYLFVPYDGRLDPAALRTHIRGARFEEVAA